MKTPGPHGRRPAGLQAARAAIMFRLLSALGFFLAFAGAAHWVVPLGHEAFALIRAQDDAARLAELQLDRTLDAARVRTEIEAALQAGDGELAESFVALAEARGIAVDGALRAKVVLANNAVAGAMRGASRFGQGFVTGEAEDLTGLAGAAAGDLTVWGDLRDGGREVLHWVRGETVDPLMLGLSGAGIAATGATYAAFGTPLALRAGLTALKGARRTGAMSARLAAHVTDALRGGKRVKLAALVGDLGTAASKAGTRATFAGLRHVDDAAGAARLRRLAEVKGGQTLAVVKTLGRGALFLTETLTRLAYRVIALVLDVIGLIASFNAMVVAMLRPLWRRKKRAGWFTGLRLAARTAP
ncbi:hypothetical protein [Ancylobacter sp. G4_0304]|uniref:hypothetical protein n=1 Tax=Ancylobacter sp. G4_0304 TaxID=3114289 RepID=UPI0039C5F939